MKNKFDEKHSESQPSVNNQNRGFELSPRQAEIYRNLEAIGPEIAAFYLDGVRTLQNKELETIPYLLAHIAREIEGGLRDVLSSKQGKQRIQKQLKKEELGDLKDRIGHIASILAALDIDDLHAPIAIKWINVATRFHQFAHRHGAWEVPRGKEAFMPLWNEFEDILTELVGTHFKLLDRIDRVLAYKQPTKEIIKTLHNLLASKVRYAYFFNKLDSPAWLKPLKDAGWFHPDSQPISQETPAQPVHFWHALGYVEKVANHIKETPCEETISTLADIVSTIVNYTHDTGASIASDHTDSQVIKIICALPIERIESRHITFIGITLKSRVGATLMDSAIGETVLPKLLDGDADKLILELFEIILGAKVYNNQIITIMEEYWLEKTLKQHGEAIANLCGFEAVQIVLKQIRSLIDEGTYSFDLIQEVESDSFDTSREDYAEILVNFVSCVYQHVKSDSIIDTVQVLLNESHEIIRRIGLNVIKHHYDDLKYLFWEWQGNPLENIGLKPELYELIKTNCAKFNKTEIEQVLQWIESAQYTTSAEDDETRAKSIAYKKRTWLSALLETDNQQVISLYQKYEQINPEDIKNPGLLWWTQTWSGDPSPITVKEFSKKSNTEIASFLNGFQKKGFPGPSVPTEEGLSKSFEECVATNPKKFTHNLRPFYSVQPRYQCSLFQGFQKAWKEKKEFNWSQLLEFVLYILSSEHFWTESDESRFDYRNWTLSAIADLIAVGTQDDDHAFNAKLLPLAEEILLILIEKVEDQQPIITIKGNSQHVNLPATFLNTAKGRVFSAIMNYALRFARINDTEQDCRWPTPIREEITKRLDRRIEPSYVFSFALGAYLANLLYLEKAWVDKNIDRIFPKQDEFHWQAAFSGYLFYSRQVYEMLYFLLKEHKHYQKALHTDFGDEREAHKELESLIAHVCVGWSEDWEKLDDEKSLIYQLINSDNPNLLSALVHFFWRQRENLPENMKAKVRPAWQAMFEVLSPKTDIEEYQDVLSRLSGWVALVDKIDAEVLNWLKFSVRYIKGFSDSTFFVEDLLTHASKTPAEVGEIYLEMLSHNVYPSHDQEHIQEIVRILYNTEHQEVADRICNLYGEAGLNFLRSLYDENQN
jgi:hypothetical protein